MLSDHGLVHAALSSKFVCVPEASGLELRSKMSEAANRGQVLSPRIYRRQGDKNRVSKPNNARRASDARRRL